MTQWNGNDAPSQDDPDGDESLLDDLGSVSTMSFPAVGDSDAEGLPPSVPPVSPHDQHRKEKRRHRWMIALTVLLTLLGVAIVVGGIYLALQKSQEERSTPALYSEAVEEASKSRESLQKVLTDTKSTVSQLSTALPNSSQVQEFSDTWDRGESLVNDPPKYFSKKPTTADQEEVAAADLRDYATTVSNVSKRLKAQKDSAGKKDAQALLSTAKTALNTAVEQGRLTLDNYNSKKKTFEAQSSDEDDSNDSSDNSSSSDSSSDDSSSGDSSDSSSADSTRTEDDGDSGSSSEPLFDTKLVTDVNDALSEATALLDASEEGTPVEMATSAVSMEKSAKTLKTAYDALQKGVNEAVEKAAKLAEEKKKKAKEKKSADESAFVSREGQIPEVLQGTWKTESGQTMTFSATTLQNMHARATRITSDEALVFPGAQVVAAWKLDANGVSGGIEDTIVGLYQQGGSQFLAVSTSSAWWRLTRP
ncbi:MAG: hypothetical protein LKJ44_04965 [Bifidobacteriaceae bacterium]|jgi:hypothetical protein|nr:hypothetical protein [Bifidobacteriaceae bacterium]MCI1979049.1 hypothetical protein [Bifidobacteriaceae bacterium]